MTGKSHITVGLLGTASLAMLHGVTMDFLGFQLLTPLLVLGSPLGSILTDIDHHNSKASNKFKVVGKLVNNKVVGKVSKHRGLFHSIWPVTGINMGALFIAELLTSPEYIGIVTILMFIYTGLMAVLAYLGKLPKFDITTIGLLSMPVLVVILTVLSNMDPYPIILSFLAGVSIGYALHIFLDMFNPKGVKLLWPIGITFKIPFVNITTGTAGETILVLAFVILFMGAVFMKGGLI